MQRLPYNGAPRAHKLRHNVISSSLFNERWQRAAHTFYPGVLVIPAVVLTSFSLSLSLSFSRCSLRCPTIVLSENLLRVVRCVALSSRGFKRNPPTYRAEPNRTARVPTLTPRFADRDIISSVRMRYLRCQSSFLYYARVHDMHHSHDYCICICALRLRAGLSQRVVYTRAFRGYRFLRIIA